MGVATASYSAEEVASLIGWWRDAGVDTAIDEAPRNWLGEATRPEAATPTAPAVQAAEPLPLVLPAFTDWLLRADLPDAGPSRRRVRPQGDASSGLMILTDMPELADIDAGMLIAGEQAAMFDRMLARLGRSRDAVWLASLNPGRPPTGRISDTALPRLSEIARHHVRIVAPKQLWLMGQAASRAILGVDDVAAAGSLHEINLDGVKVSVIATAHPRRLAGSDDLKRRAWVEMQRLIAESGT